MCTDVEGHEKLLVPKIDLLMKHTGRRKAVVDMEKVKRDKYYYLGSNQYIKNERVFFAKGSPTMVMKLMVGGLRSGAER